MVTTVRGSWKLVSRPDGRAGVEIVTSKPLGALVGWDGITREPAAYLEYPGTFNIGVQGPSRGDWRRLSIRASVVDLNARLVEDFIDVSGDNANRDLVAAMSKQTEVPVYWVNERVEIRWQLPPEASDGFETVLRNTEGISARDYAEELAEVRWKQSASYRPGAPRPRRYKPRSAAPPVTPIPFFAKRSGAIPRKGRPQMAGVMLPDGVRLPAHAPAYWASDEPVENIGLLAPWLASRFPGTGLWPLLWRFPEDPANYMSGHGNIHAIDDQDTRGILASRGLDSSAPVDPAASTTSQNPNEGPFPDWAVAEPARLLLVPCNRPADAVTALGGVAGETPPELTSALLRSWEDRFGAVLYEVAPTLTRLHVSRPAQHAEQAIAIAAELRATDPLVAERTGEPTDTARILLDGEAPILTDPSIPRITATNWDIAW